jgi:DNA-binding NarL/FixJ family response regulator
MRPNESFDHNPRPCEVLIVADNQGDAHLLEALLQASDLGRFRCTLVDRLDDARDRLKYDTPDAVLFDVGRTNVTGLKRLNALAAVQRAPIVVVAATADEWLRRQALKRGAVDFVPKQHVEVETLARSIRMAVERTRLADRSTQTLLDEPCDATSPRTDQNPDAIGSIVDEVCRAVHDRFRADVHIIADTHGSPLVPENAAIARSVFENLLVGLSTASREMNAGGLKLHIRTGGTHSAVLVSIDAFADERREEYCSLVLGLVVGQRDDPLLDHHLTESSVAIRDLGGIVRCRPCDDGRLWLQISLPTAAMPSTASRVTSTRVDPARTG